MTSTWEAVSPIEPSRRFTQVAVGRFHTCALAAEGRVLCTGKNDSGQCAQGNTEYQISSFTEILR
jgi:alpha-tubulin suppressor-like RCC1 family protein